MSIELMAWVWRQSRARGTELLLLLAVADCANSEGEAWPSMATLAAKARLSERQCRRLVGELVELGELAVVRGSGRGLRSRYKVGQPLPEKGTLAAGNGEKRGTSAAAFSVEKGTGATALGVGKGTSGAGFSGEKGTGLTGKGDMEGRAIKEEPSGTVIGGIEGEECPPELALFDAELRGLAGYDPDARFYFRVAGYSGVVDLYEAAVRMRGWLEEPRQRKAGRRCSRGFVLGWLRREVGGGASVAGGGASVVGKGVREGGGAAGLGRFG